MVPLEISERPSGRPLGGSRILGKRERVFSTEKLFQHYKCKNVKCRDAAALRLRRSPTLPPSGQTWHLFKNSLFHVYFKATLQICSTSVLYLNCLHSILFCCVTADGSEGSEQSTALNVKAWWCPSAAKWWLLHKRGQALSPCLTDWIVSSVWAAPPSYNDASPSQRTRVSR